MLVGDPNKFAIESEMSIPDDRLSILGIGFFVIYISGIRYGVFKNDATCLGNSFYGVQERLVNRGKHAVPFCNRQPEEIANAVRIALYADSDLESYFGIEQREFTNLVYDNHIVWAPDGDEAFDDGSMVLHFDIEPYVRLIGFRTSDNNQHIQSTLSDLKINADEFYSILCSWQSQFWTDRLKLLSRT